MDKPERLYVVYDLYSQDEAFVVAAFTESSDAENYCSRNDGNGRDLYTSLSVPFDQGLEELRTPLKLYWEVRFNEDGLVLPAPGVNTSHYTPFPDHYMARKVAGPAKYPIHQHVEEQGLVANPAESRGTMIVTVRAESPSDAIREAVVKRQQYLDLLNSMV